MMVLQNVYAGEALLAREERRNPEEQWRQLNVTWPHIKFINHPFHCPARAASHAQLALEIYQESATNNSGVVQLEYCSITRQRESKISKRGSRLMDHIHHELGRQQGELPF